MTPRERCERLIDLGGEIKQADHLVAECERDVNERWRQYETAMDAVQKQRERRLALYDEAKRLGEEAKADFDALVPEGLPVHTAWDFAKPEGSEVYGGFEAGDVAGVIVPRSAGDAFDQAITDAFNAATTPQDTGDKTHIFGNGRLP